MISKVKLFFLFFQGCNIICTLCFSSMIYGGNPDQDRIIGEWQVLYGECNDDRTLTITDTYLITSSSVIVMRHSYSLAESDSTDKGITIKLFNGEFSPDNGLTYYEISGGKDTLKATISLEEEILILLIWKGGDRSGEYQLAEAYTRKKESKPVVYQPEIRSVFYLPEGYTGYSYVVLEQPEGEPVEYDMGGRRILHIPHSGLLLTRSRPMPAALAKREFAFYYQKKDGNPVECIPVVPQGCLYNLSIQQFNEEQIRETGFDPDGIYVYYYRYNPGREIINKLFEKDIKGQVLMIRVDTLRNLLSLDN